MGGYCTGRRCILKCSGLYISHVAQPQAASLASNSALPCHHCGVAAACGDLKIISFIICLLMRRQSPIAVLCPRAWIQRRIGKACFSMLRHRLSAKCWARVLNPGFGHAGLCCDRAASPCYCPPMYTWAPLTLKMLPRCDRKVSQGRSSAGLKRDAAVAPPLVPPCA